MKNFSKYVSRDGTQEQYDVLGLEPAERERYKTIHKRMGNKKQRIIESISRRKYRQYVCDKCESCTPEQLDVHNNAECIEFDHKKSKFVNLSILHKMLFIESNVRTRLMLIAFEIAECYRGSWLCGNHHFEKTLLDNEKKTRVPRSDVFGGLIIGSKKSPAFTRKEVKTLIDEINRKADESGIEPLKYYFEIMKQQRERPDLSITTTDTRKTTKTTMTTTIVTTKTTTKTTILASNSHKQQEIIPQHVTVEQLVMKCHERLKKMHEFETCAREMTEKILSGTEKYYFAEFDAKKAYEEAFANSSATTQLCVEEMRKKYEMSKRIRHYCAPIQFEGEKVQYKDYSLNADNSNSTTTTTTTTVRQRSKKIPSLKATQHAANMSILFTIEKEIDPLQPTIEWKKFRQMRRAWAVQQLGGKCVQCNCTNALEFNHVHGEKNGNVSTFLAEKTLEAVKKELTKCQLLCKNCHHIFTDLQQRKMIDCPVELKKFHEKAIFSGKRCRDDEETIHAIRKRLKISSIPNSMFYSKENERTRILKKNDNGKYSCSEQGCTFSADYPSGILRHVRIHTKEKPWGCPFEKCTRSFKRSDHIRSHLRNFHKDQEITLVEHRDENNMFCKYEIEFN